MRDAREEAKEGERGERRGIKKTEERSRSLEIHKQKEEKKNLERK